MKTDLDELIATCKQLCDSLDLMAQEEMRFGFYMQAELERISWEMLKHQEDLKSIKEWVG